MGAGLGSDLIWHGARFPHLLFGFDVADRLALGIAELVGSATVQHGPGPLHQLAGDRDAGLGEPPWVRRRVCGLRDLPVGGLGSSLPVMVFELNRGQVPDRGVEPVGVVPVDPAGDLPFDVAAVGPGRPGLVDGFGLEQPDG